MIYKKITGLIITILALGLYVSANDELWSLQPKSIWTIGTQDDSFAEFAPNIKKKTLTIDPSSPLKQIPNGLSGAKVIRLNINFNVAEIPEYGAIFSFKLLNATQTGPQTALFLNEQFGGLIQLWGTAPMNKLPKWKKTYELYIPKNLFKKGQNQLSLELVPPMWSDLSVLNRFEFQYDYLKLTSLSAPAREAVHGKRSYMGTVMTHSHRGFHLDNRTIGVTEIGLPWLGIAYSGNTMRANFWFDVPKVQPGRLDLLKKFKELNMTAVIDHIAGHVPAMPNGELAPVGKESLVKLFDTYGEYIQFYELGNEPCMFGGAYEDYLATAKYISENKPEHVKLVATGWAYGGGKGTPVNWSADPIRRRKIEEYCDYTNGHSYGSSYNNAIGGSFVENLKTYGEIKDGWPKDGYLNTETGTNNWHSELNGPNYQSSAPHASAFDRIMRAHIAVVDYTLQHAFIFNDFGLFQENPQWDNPKSLKVISLPNNEMPRVYTFRRLALAYATHGTPLEYEVLNREELKNKKVYVRPVDTAGIAGQIGSNATSEKVLINLVNFENVAQSIKVKIKMPQISSYSGLRVGNGMDYESSHKNIESLSADPYIEFSELLAPGEGVQYILESKQPSTPYSPLRVSGRELEQGIELSWAGSAFAKTYILQQKQNNSDWKTLANNITNCKYIDKTVPHGTAVQYRVIAVGDKGQSDPSATINLISGVPLQPEFIRGVAGDKKITLTLPPLPKNATHFELYRIKNGENIHVGSKLQSGVFEDKGLENGSFYHYNLIAVNKNGDSMVRKSFSYAPSEPLAAPSNFSITAIKNIGVINFAPVANADHYLVERAINNGPFKKIGGKLSSPQFVDRNITPQNEYQYKFYSVNESYTSVASKVETLKSIEPTALDSWTDVGIGTSENMGEAFGSEKDKLILLSGGGHDIWGPSDGVRFVYQELKGDFTISCRIVSYTNTHNLTKFGIMAREMTHQSSPMFFIGNTPSATIGNWRLRFGDQTKQASRPTGPYLKLERRGDVISGSVSPDGTLWRKSITEKWTDKPLLVGFVVCSHNEEKLNTVIFDQVNIQK